MRRASLTSRALLLTASACLILGFAPASKPRAAAVPATKDCSDNRGVDRCRPEQQRRVRDLFGVKPIEAHRDAGDQVRRAFYVDGYGHDVVAIAFVRPKGGDPSLWVHFPRGSDGKRSEPLSAPVPLETWRGVIERSVHFDRQLVPLPGEGAPVPGEIRLCLHGSTYTVEGADPANGEHRSGTLRRRTENGCDNGLTEAYALELQRAAVPLLAPCARLDPRQYGSEAKLLSTCQILAGDRLAAAEVANRAYSLGFMREAKEGQLTELFRYEATVDWNGERNAGAGSASRFWTAKALEGGGTDFYYHEIEGKSPSRVVLKGMLYRSIEVPDGAPSRDLVAQVEQVWTDNGGGFAILSATVGPFEPGPPRP